MLLFFDLVAIFITTFLTVMVVYQLFYKRMGSIIAICEIAFYASLVVPLIIGIFIDYSTIYSRSLTNVILAVKDLQTGIIYDIFVIIICLIMCYTTRHARYQHKFNFNILNSQLLTFLCYLGMISPLAAVIIAPKSSVYLQMGYFHRSGNNVASTAYSYHTQVMDYVVLIALVATVLFYYIKHNSTGTGVIVALSTILFSWVQGGRSYLALAMAAVILVDIVKMEGKKSVRKILYKAFIFLVIFIIYFLSYRSIVGKGISNSILELYELYLSRMSAVKTAIYATLHNESMLAYHGQSLLFDFLFFIPRSIWSRKPVLFTRYYTSYAHGLSYGVMWSGGNLLTNIWTEHIANFGFFGILTAVIFIYLIVYVSEHSRNDWVYLSGLIFITLYTLNAFSGITMYLFYIWLILCIVSRILSKRKRRIIIRFKWGN